MSVISGAGKQYFSVNYCFTPAVTKYFINEEKCLARHDITGRVTRMFKASNWPISSQATRGYPEACLLKVLARITEGQPDFNRE